MDGTVEEFAGAVTMAVLYTISGIEDELCNVYTADGVTAKLDVEDGISDPDCTDMEAFVL